LTSTIPLVKNLWGIRAGAPRAPLLVLSGLLAVGAAIFAPVSPLAVTVPPPTHSPSAGLPWLSTQGTNVVDETGNLITLRGFNTDALLDYSAWTQSPITESDATLMQISGFDVVRIGISWSAIEPTRGVFDQAYIDRIQTLVKMFAKHQIYSVLEMHFLDWGPQFNGVGAPRWANVPLVPDIELGSDLAWKRHLSPAVNAAFGYFWASDDWQADFRGAWQQVAQRFVVDPSVVGYDLFNEPHPLPSPPIWYEKHQLWPLYQKTINAVGQVDPNHIFIVEGDFFGGMGTTIVPISGVHLIYSAHFYTGSLIPPIYSGDPMAMQAQFAELKKEAVQLNAPLWIGETGIDTQAPSSAAWIRTLVNLASTTAGFAWWQWKEPKIFGDWSVLDQNGALNQTLLAALATPYVRARPSGVSASAISSGITLRTDGVSSPVDVTIAWPFTPQGSPAVSSTCDVQVRANDQSGTVAVQIPANTPCLVGLSTMPRAV
jgi:endoglycosylceramidase